jgi:hypothetical protein
MRRFRIGRNSRFNRSAIYHVAQLSRLPVAPLQTKRSDEKSKSSTFVVAGNYHPQTIKGVSSKPAWLAGHPPSRRLTNSAAQVQNQ